MKALSLTQPWASLVAIGAKKIETRSWTRSYQGPIAIHASKGFPKECREMCGTAPFYDALVDGGITNERELPLGAIVALARVVHILPTFWLYEDGERIGLSVGSLDPTQRGDWAFDEEEEAFGDYSKGRFAWFLADVKRLPQPVPCTGALGLWTVPPDVAALVEHALAVSV